MPWFLDGLASAIERKAEASTKIGQLEEMWAGLFGGQASKSGVSVNWQTALRVTTAAACLARIAEATSTVPCKLYQKRVGDKSPRHATDHPLNGVIQSVANDVQNSLEFREQTTYHAVLEGNAYSYINRVRGDIRELVPFEHGSLIRIDKTDPFEWRYTFRIAGGGQETFAKSEIWHFRNASWMTGEGLKAVVLLRDAIGLAIASEETQAMLHANGAHPGGLLSLKGKATQPTIDRLKQMAEERLQGLRNAFRTIVLDQEATWQSFQMKGVDAEHLATRRFQVEEVCRGMGVLPIMVGQVDKAATYAGAEQMFLHHVVHTARPWHRRFEYSMDHQLLTPQERADGYYFGFVDSELLRGDHKARSEFYKTGIEAGWMLPEEARAYEEMPYVAGLDRPRIPLNTTVVGQDGLPVNPEKSGGGNAA